MRSERRTAKGVSGASRVSVVFPEHGVEVTLKWKSMPASLDGINNSPRREIASYRVQPLFLDPEDFVVPPSVARCLAPEEFAQPDLHRKPTRENTGCELGIFSLWLEDVEIPELLYDEARFVSDPVYARYLANFNILTYLIRHRDGRRGNFLVARDDSRRIVFAIDNGISFSGFVYNWFIDNWDDLKVPALPRDSVARLRDTTAADLQALGVVVQFERDDDAMLRVVVPGANFDPNEGVRIRDGTIQLGLTADEIAGIAERIERLLGAVDTGEIPVF